MKLKWYGTAMVLIEHEGTHLLFDPFFSLNDKLFKPSFDEFTAVENIFVTHGHFDHIAGIPDIIKLNKKAKVFCTTSPQKTLISKGVEEKRIFEIKPGDVLNIEPFEVRVLKGKHVVFDMKIIIKTLCNLGLLTQWRNLRYILRENKLCAEAGETVIYEINAAGKRMLLLGSLNLDKNIDYPKNVDLLILPFQGRSDIIKYAISFINHLHPKNVLLNHFTDTFPPISSEVKTEPFVSQMWLYYPNIPVICPKAGVEWGI